MTAVAIQPLHLHRLEVSNFLRVEALTVDAEGRHVVLSGPNGSGKTSAVEAIWTALRGASVRDVPEPIHQGARRASVTLDLGEYRVERRWTEQSTSLVVTAADGSRVARPQQLLDGLLGRYALDPLAFLARRPQDQVDDVLSMGGVAPPVARVTEIAGECLPARPGESADAYLLRLSGDETGLVYQRRREAHRLAEQKSQALEEQRRLVESQGGAGERGEAASATELLAQAERLQQEADARRAALEDASRAREEHARGRRKLQELSELAGKCATDAERTQAEIARLNELLASERAAAETLAARIARGAEVVGDLDEAATKAEQAATALADPGPRLAGVRRQLAIVERDNEQRLRRRVAIEQLQRLAEEVATAQAEHQHLEGVLCRLRDLRAHLLDGVDLGVPGLEACEGGLRLGGVPLRQASQAEQIRTACAVAMAAQPRLRLLRIDGGESLDRNSVELLLNVAKEKSFQVVMTRVADGEALRVEIVDENG